MIPNRDKTKVGNEWKLSPFTSLGKSFRNLEFFFFDPYKLADRIKVY